MEKPVVNVDVDPQSPFVVQLQKSFPQFEVVAQQVTPNDHANARAFSHLASKLIELEVPTTATILDIGSAPARRMFSEHQYHCVCPMRSPEDPDRMMKYASKLAEKACKITNKNLHEKIKDLRTVLDTPDAETPSLCFHNDVTCNTRAEYSVMQDVYINAPGTIYHQAMKGVRTLYWIGFDTTQFMFSAMAGSYPAYNTNWADEKVLEARNIGLCSTKLSEGRTGKLSIMRKKELKPIASFDKSQDDAMALTGLMILEDLGVDQPLLDLIECAFGEISSTHLPTGTRFKFGAMMKSGMFLTLFVNTVLNVVIASRVLEERLKTSKCAAFIGDDNIIHGVVSDKEMAERCATWLNMEVKIIDAVIGERPPYFCGGFILQDSVTSTACRVADPLKRLFKLGKPLPADDEQDEDRRRALLDETKAWFRVGITDTLAVAVATRYEVDNITPVLLALRTFAQSKRAFQAIRGEIKHLYGGPK